MSLLSLLGWKSPGIGVCCGEAHDALRYANATIVALRWEKAVLLNELERARDVAGTFLCCDGINHGEPS